MDYIESRIFNIRLVELSKRQCNIIYDLSLLFQLQQVRRYVSGKEPLTEYLEEVGHYLVQIGEVEKATVHTEFIKNSS